MSSAALHIVLSCMARIRCLHSGDAGKGKKRVWIIARQHPGESMAEWFVEGDLPGMACILTSRMFTDNSAGEK